MIAAKFLFLTLAIGYGFSNTVKAIRGMKVSEPQMWSMAIGVAGFVTLQWLM